MAALPQVMLLHPCLKMIMPVLQQHKADVLTFLIFGRKGMLADVFTRGSSLANQPEPVIIAREVLQPVLASAPTPAPTGLEIVPWKSVP